jgi:geranylgeranyl diphosphate synthase type II
VLSGARSQALQSPERILAAIEVLSTCAGEDGMVAGQVLDLQWEARGDLSREQLELVHNYKTGALLRCAVELGRIAAGGTEAQSKALESYAAHLGMAFQIRDDILDVVGSREELGKPIGSDAENQKTTFVTLLGLEQSQVLVEQHTEEAKAALCAFEHPEFLCQLADQLAGRTK